MDNFLCIIVIIGEIALAHKLNLIAHYLGLW